MTQTAQNESARYTVELTTEKDREMARVMFQSRPGLSKQFEKSFGVQFLEHHDSSVVFTGEAEQVAKVQDAFKRLAGMFAQGTFLSKNIIKDLGVQLNPRKASPMAEFNAANQNTKSPGGPGSSSSHFVPKTQAQADFSTLIDNNDLSFGTGPAGTGKTHVAVVKGIGLLKSGAVKKLLLARPAQESGEKLGFLPGSANDKLAPYMRPIYDELDKAYGPGKWQKLMADSVIEIAPIGFMRGRTFTDAFIIVDEAQNCSIEQLKMALTRIGENSKMVVTGDESQIDLDDKSRSGLMWAVGKLEGKPGIGVQEFKAVDVVRSKIVQVIVDALAEEPAAKPAAAPKTQQNQGTRNDRY